MRALKREMIQVESTYGLDAEVGVPGNPQRRCLVLVVLATGSWTPAASERASLPNPVEDLGRLVNWYYTMLSAQAVVQVAWMRPTLCSG